MRPEHFRHEPEIAAHTTPAHLNLLDLTSDRPLTLVRAGASDSAPAFEPQKWNQNPEIANCYIYALNNFNPRYSDRYTQMDPGNLGDYPDLDTSSPRGSELRKYANLQIFGAMADGLRWTGNNATPARDHYKVALFVSPAVPDDNHEHSMDYHWLRQDRNGLWSHKFGSLPVTNLDNAGNIITDPRRARLGLYQFVGYFDVPANGIDLGRNTDGSTSQPRLDPPQRVPQLAPPMQDARPRRR